MFSLKYSTGGIRSNHFPNLANPFLINRFCSSKSLTKICVHPTAPLKIVKNIKPALSCLKPAIEKNESIRVNIT